ncbi:hypothetical protein F4778DRAFT_224518 [Xylariomycetidae sp. FL2044]|nr:hypothetical protein F4778DRAFT_224518 [Xylariomycetidae sp. FL2044]
MSLFPMIDSSSSSTASSSGTAATSITTPDTLPMRVFLCQTAKGIFSSSGGYKANICLLRYLASRGHCVRQLCYACRGEVERYVHMARNEGWDPRLRRSWLHLRAEDGTSGRDTIVGVSKLTMEDGIEVVALDDLAFVRGFGGQKKMHKNMAREIAAYIEDGKLSGRLSDFVTFLQGEITKFSPTHIITNDGLSMQSTCPSEMPYLDLCRLTVVHTAEQLPFGPFAGGVPGHASSPKELDLLRELDGIWSVSNAIKRYAHKYGQLATDFLVHHPWTYLEEKTHQIPDQFHNGDKKFIGMINPCPVKGSKILLDIAKACPHLDFLIYKSWGCTKDLEKEMKSLPNMTVRPSCTDMNEAWRDMKVLLVPSVWYEAWGIVVIEAHSRGIPVVCSDAGALPETMRGLDHVIPIKAIDGKRHDDATYVIPEQDIDPWVETLNELMSDRNKYEQLASKVREETVEWLENLDEAELESWMYDSKNKVW